MEPGEHPALAHMLSAYAPADFAALHEALTEVLTREIGRLTEMPADDRDLDRDAIRAVFDHHGIGHFDLDFDAPLIEFLGQLMYVHEDLLPSWQAILRYHQSDAARADEVQRRQSRAPRPR